MLSLSLVITIRFPVGLQARDSQFSGRKIAVKVNGTVYGASTTAPDGAIEKKFAKAILNYCKKMGVKGYDVSSNT